MPSLGLLLDGSVGQLSRPAKNIELPGAFLAPLEGRALKQFLAGEELVYSVNRCSILYRRIEDQSFKSSKDWTPF
jgi:hypothetical protein